MRLRPFTLANGESRPLIGCASMVGAAVVLVGSTVLAGCSPPPFVQCALAEMLRADPAEQPPDTVTVAPAAETVPVDDPCDAADDPAIWVNAAEPAASLIVGTNKQRGLIVYALDGTVVSRHDAGRMNNVDLRPRRGTPSGERIVVAGRPTTSSGLPGRSRATMPAASSLASLASAPPDSRT